MPTTGVARGERGPRPGPRTGSRPESLPIYLISECQWAIRRKCCVGDRKSTRLNSSHLGISYDVFCLKKKKKELNKLFTKKVKKRNIKNKNVYSRGHRKATTNMRKMESINAVYQDRVASVKQPSRLGD